MLQVFPIPRLLDWYTPLFFSTSYYAVSRMDVASNIWFKQRFWPMFFVFGPKAIFQVVKYCSCSKIFQFCGYISSGKILLMFQDFPIPRFQDWFTAFFFRMSYYVLSRMDVASNIWFKRRFWCMVIVFGPMVIFQVVEYCSCTKFFQFRGFKTDSLHYFSVHYTMAYEEWMLHRRLGLNGDFDVCFSCSAPKWFFKW